MHGDEEIDRRALEDAVVDAGSGQGMYVVGSRWHEGTMIAMLRQMESATYGWRYATTGYQLSTRGVLPPTHTTPHS